MGMGTDNDTTPFLSSFIDFSFCDSNEGLELEMECSRFTNGSLMDDENFYPCDKRGVVFKFGREGLEVQRAFKSPWLVPSRKNISRSQELTSRNITVSDLHHMTALSPSDGQK